MVQLVPRNDARARFSVEDRVVLLEQDLDTVDVRFESQISQLRAAQGRLTGIALGILVALTTNAVVILALGR